MQIFSRILSGQELIDITGEQVKIFSLLIFTIHEFSMMLQHKFERIKKSLFRMQRFTRRGYCELEQIQMGNCWISEYIGNGGNANCFSEQFTFTFYIKLVLI